MKGTKFVPGYFFEARSRKPSTNEEGETMVREKFLGGGKYLALGLVLMMALFSFYGCSGDDGSAGAPGTPGTPGTSTGTISGVVTNNITSTAVAGATITTSPAIQGVSISTNASGAYSANLPIGTYTLTISKTNFNNATATVTLSAGQTVTKDVALVPKGNVVVNAGADQSGAPAGTVSLSALVEVLDGSTGTPVCAWTQTEGATAAIATPNACDTDVTLASGADYKAALFAHLEDLDRTMVQAVNPHAMELGGEAAFEVEVTVDGNVVSDEVAVTVALPYAINGGINTVPVEVPVLLHGKGSLADWTWSIDTAPGTSTATLDDAAAQNPSFTPDVAGRYDISVTNSGALVNSISVYAGTWAGVMGNVAGLSSDCTGCHVAGATPAGEVRAKMDEWLNSGHAEIFTQNIDNPAGHWGIGCASCHTVGYNEAADNNGFDEAVASEGWVVPPHGDVGTWADMLVNFPETAQLANIQCENCHGPNNSTTLHLNGTLMDGARVSLASDVCGACHGEPLRHARFQQWETSAHANYELAIDEGMSTSCARCHSAQGFLVWLPLLEAGASGSIPAGSITWDADSVHPQTCATCHPVHDPGDTSGAPGVNNAKVRVDGSTSLLPAGFMATGVGKGATCMTCHNSRNGLHNNANLPAGSQNDRAPHVASQTDVLMGQNAYFVAVGGGSRSPHSFIGDSCVTCHMELTPPPAELSYQLGGTNHSFAASLSICADCHGTFDGGTLQATVASMLDELQAAMEAYMLDAITAYQGGGGTIVAQDGDSVDHVLGNVSSVVAEESHGRQAFIVTDDASCSATPCTVQVRKFVKDDIAGGGNNNGLYDATDPMLIPDGDALVEAGWNYYLIHGDGSMGVHNPGFTLDVIEASINAL